MFVKIVEDEDDDGGENAVEDIFGHKPGNREQEMGGEEAVSDCALFIIPSAASGWGKRALGEKKNGELPAEPDLKIK